MAVPPPAPGSTCLVTGASSGIGAELARVLAARGYGVTLVARRTDRLDQLAAELSEAHGIRAETLECDLSDERSRTRMLAQLAELGLTVDILVNNAGFGGFARFPTRAGDEEVGMVRVNVEAVVALCARFVPEMVERGRGGILNVASIAGFQPLPRNTTYAATKAFVLHFTEGLADDLSDSGVAVTALCPGPVKTEFGPKAGAGREQQRLPGFVWTDARDVAEQGVSGLERGKRVVIPGLLNRAGAIGGQHAPRSLLLRAVGRVLPFE